MAKNLGPGTLIAGKFVLKEVLGRGGCGTVYRAHHQDLDEDVALKLLNPEVAENEETRKRFLREVKSTRSFVHPPLPEPGK